MKSCHLKRHEYAERNKSKTNTMTSLIDGIQETKNKQRGKKLRGRQRKKQTLTTRNKLMATRWEDGGNR